MEGIRTKWFESVDCNEARLPRRSHIHPSRHDHGPSLVTLHYVPRRTDPSHTQPTECFPALALRSSLSAALLQQLPARSNFTAVRHAMLPQCSPDSLALSRHTVTRPAVLLQCSTLAAANRRPSAIRKLSHRYPSVSPGRATPWWTVAL